MLPRKVRDGHCTRVLAARVVTFRCPCVMMSNSRKYNLAASPNGFCSSTRRRRGLPRNCKYQSSANSFAFERLSSLVVVRRLRPAKYVAHCQLELFGRL